MRKALFPLTAAALVAGAALIGSAVAQDLRLPPELKNDWAGFESAMPTVGKNPADRELPADRAQRNGLVVLIERMHTEVKYLSLRSWLSETVSGAAQLLAVAAMATVKCWPADGFAGPFGRQIGRKAHTIHISSEKPLLAPIAHTRFCLRHPQDCEARSVAVGGSDSGLTKACWAQLVTVNGDINRAIVPQRNYGGVWEDIWRVSPDAGDCSDYAVTKRNELLSRGWPSRSLLLAEVIVPGGEHHLVLVVRTLDGDFVLDNLSPTIRQWWKTGYQWIRIQSPANPNYWSAMRRTTL